MNLDTFAVKRIMATSDDGTQTVTIDIDEEQNSGMVCIELDGEVPLNLSTPKLGGLIRLMQAAQEALWDINPSAATGLSIPAEPRQPYGETQNGPLVSHVHPESTQIQAPPPIERPAPIVQVPAGYGQQQATPTPQARAGHPITEKQYKAISAMGNKLGIAVEQMQLMAKEFDPNYTTLDDMDRAAASKLYEKLDGMIKDQAVPR